MEMKKIKEELEKRLKEKKALEKKVEKKASKKSDKAILRLNSKIDFLNKKLNELLFVKKKKIKEIKKIESLFDKGILEVSIPARDEIRPRKLQING